MIMTPAELKAAAVNEISQAKASLEKFKASLDIDPSHAMEWSDRAFSAAAKVRVYSVIVESLEYIETNRPPTTPEKWMEAFVAGLRQDVMNGARWGTNDSTSRGANFMRDHVLATKAELLRELVGREL